LELIRLDKIRLALDGKRADPRVADTLIRLSERVSRLHGLDAPQRSEISGPGGGPIQTQEDESDLGKLSHDELLIFEVLYKKTLGHPDWDKEIRHQCEMKYPTRSGLFMAFARAMLSETQPQRVQPARLTLVRIRRSRAVTTNPFVPQLIVAGGLAGKSSKCSGINGWPRAWRLRCTKPFAQSENLKSIGEMAICWLT
jgi:hypothetical protein